MSAAPTTAAATDPSRPKAKQRASANSLKHGFYAHIEKLNPHDAPIYQRLLQDLRLGLLPDGAVEEMMVRELAMLSARLQRLEAAEYAILCSQLDAPPEPAPAASERKGHPSTSCEDNSVLRDETLDSRQIAAAFLNTQDDLDRLHKIEVHLRRAYNRTWDRLRHIQKERRKLTPQENAKRTYHWICAQEQRQKPEPDLGDLPPLPSAEDTPPLDPDRYPPPHPETRSDPHQNPRRKEPRSA
jgi:hypothetical protein